MVPNIEDSPPLQRKRPTRIAAKTVKYTCDDGSDSDVKQPKGKANEDSEMQLSEGDLIESDSDCPDIQQCHTEVQVNKVQAFRPCGIQQAAKIK